MSTIVDSFGQTFPHVQFRENHYNRSPSNTQQNNNNNTNGIATINNGKMKSLTPPQMYEFDAPVEEYLDTNNNPSQNKLQKTTKNGINESVANAHMDAFTRKKGLPWVLASQMFLIFILLFVIAFLLYKIYLFEEYNKEEKINFSNNNCFSPQNSEFTNLPKFKKIKSFEAKFKKAAVVSDNVMCSELGRNILLRGGNAIDAAISVSFCLGGLNFYSAGLGGGFLLTFFRRFDGKCITIDALPSRTNNFTKNLTETGYNSISIPGELHGLWTAYKRFGSGKITWSDLIMPTVNILGEGFPVSKTLEKLSKIYFEKFNETNQEMRNLLLNPTTGEYFREGQIIRNPLLVETYKKLANSHDPIQLFYGTHGPIARQIIDEFGQNGGLITRKDLQNYKSIIDEQPFINTFDDPKLVFCGPKSSIGYVKIQLIFAIIQKLFPNNNNSNNAEYWQYFIETQNFINSKFANFNNENQLKILIQNITQNKFIENIIHQIKINLNSSETKQFLKNKNGQVGDIGGSHLSIVDSDGNTISMTHSINSPFGSLRRSPLLGIIWNNQMLNLNNFLEFTNNNRLISPLCPLIIYNRENKKIKLAIGANGERELQAISSLSQVLIQSINFNKTLKDSVEMSKIFTNQFGIFYESDFEKSLIENLRKKGYKIDEIDNYPNIALNGIFREENSTNNYFLSAVNDQGVEFNNFPAGY